MTISILELEKINILRIDFPKKIPT
jgi:hypothetical protein